MKFHLDDGLMKFSYVGMAAGSLGLPAKTKAAGLKPAATGGNSAKFIDWYYGLPQASYR